MTLPRLDTLLVVSFVLAGLSVAPVFVGDPAILFSVFVVGPAWLVLAVVILVQYGLRGLWVLFGLPFALVDLWYALLIWACSRGQGCL